MNSDLTAKTIVDGCFPPGKITKEKAVELWATIVKHIEESRNEALEEAAHMAEIEAETHLKYADNYEEGLHDMADLLSVSIRGIKSL